MQLDGKVAVVTGSGNGIGEAIARRFAAARARVVVTDIEQEAVERVADELGTVGIAADITAADSVRAVADLARATYGEVDLWLSNAGVAGPRQPRSLQDDGLWDLMWRLHMLSHLHAVREVLPSMIARGDGYLLQTASSVALSTQPEKAAYSVTEFAAGHPALEQALTPQQVADVVMEGVAAERFLIVTRPGSEHVLADKGTDYDAWIGQAAARFPGGPPAGRAMTASSLD